MRYFQSDPKLPVLVPGDPERNSTKKVDEEGGVLYHENQLKASVSKIVHAVQKFFENLSFFSFAAGYFNVQSEK